MNINDLEKLLSKYIAVWIWSILFGANSALLYTLVQYRTERWGRYGLFLILVAIFSVAFVCLSLMYLFRYLSYYLLPSIFDLHASPGDTDLAKSGIILSRACYFLIIAAIARAMMALADMFLGNLQGF